MEIFNTTTKETIEITLIDPVTGIDWSGDFMGNAISVCEDFTYNEDMEKYEANELICDWWLNYCTEYQEADDLVYEWKKDADDEIVSYYENYIGGVEFEDLPSCMKKFVEENQPEYKNKAEEEMLEIKFLFFDGDIKDGLTAKDSNEILERMNYAPFVSVQDIMDQETWVFSDDSYITRNEDRYYTGDDITKFEVESMIGETENEND